MKTRKSVFIYSKEFEKYPYPAENPFNTSRPGQVYRLLKSMGLLSGENIIEAGPEPADRLTLKKFHTARYIHTLKESNDGNIEPEAYVMGIGTPDCPIFKGMYEYSALACGATLLGIEFILSGKADSAFNPSGGLHHAMPDRASGFCYLNDNAIGCTVLAEAGKRVLYLDVDVHHGDGVQYAFFDRKDVMTISFHQDGRTLFPGTGFEDDIGTGEGKGYSVNVPLPIGTYDEAYVMVYREIAEPLIAKFNPDVFVFELGADALSGDPLANLCLTNNIYAEILHNLLSFNKPIIMTGGGGYNIENTVRAWALAWSVLSGADDQQMSNIGLGGVMLQTNEWQGGLRDRKLVIPKAQQDFVLPIVKQTIEKVKTNVFKFHGLK